MKIKTVTMTPKLAAELLATSTFNRPLNLVRVKVLADAMRNGRFYPEASGTIAIGEDGTLHNGEHRLRATVESQHHWEAILVEGAREAARMHYDTGKNRSFTDYLRFRRIPDASSVAAHVRLLYLYDNGALATRTAFTTARPVPVDFEALWEFYEKNPDRIAAGRVFRNRMGDSPVRVMSGSVAAVAGTVLHDIDADDADAFFGYLAMTPGAGLPPVMLTLIRALANLPAAGTGGVRGDQQHQLAVVFKGWNSWRDGEQPQVIVWKLGGRHPEKFPVPH